MMLGLTLSVVVSWYGLVFARSYVKLGQLQRRPIYVNEVGSLTNLIKGGYLETVGGLEYYMGIVIGKRGCLRLWNGWTAGCYVVSSAVSPLIILGSGDGLVSRYVISNLERGGWVTRKKQILENGIEVDVYVSNIDKVGVRGLMRIVRFGDIVGVVTNHESGEVTNLIMVYRGGLL